MSSGINRITAGLKIARQDAAERQPEAFITRGRKGRSYAADLAAVSGDARVLGYPEPRGAGGVWGKDSLWICGKANGRGMNAVSPLHPGAVDFLNRPVASRGRITGFLAARTIDEVMTVEYGAQVLNIFHGGRWQTVTDPLGRPACFCKGGGDGIASRYKLTTKTRVQTPCGAHLCPEFNIKMVPNGQGKEWPTRDCKVTTRLRFVLDAPDLPGMYVEARTAGGKPSDNQDDDGASEGTWAGYGASQWFDWYSDLEAQWKMLRLPGEPDLFGLPIALTVRAKTKASADRGDAIHLADLSLNLPPGQTLFGWFIARANALAEIEGAARLTDRVLPALLAAPPPAAAPARGAEPTIDADFEEAK